MKNRIRLILSFTIPNIIFIIILGILLVSIFIPINRDFYFNEVSVDVNTVKKDVEGKVDDIVNSLSFLSSLGINTSNIAQTITNVRQFGSYFDVFYCNTVPYNRGGTFISSRITYPANYDQTTREWYVNASKSADNLYMTEPYVDFTTDKLVITFINKIKINNRLAGYFGIDFDNMNMLVSEKNNETINIVTKEGLYITHDNEDYILNNTMLLFSDELFSSYRNNMNDNNIYKR